MYEDQASFLSPNEVRVGQYTITAKAIIIATGSVVSHLPIPGLEEVGYITSDEALNLRELPQSMIVLGGGPVAVELAQFYSRIGTKVTLIQRSNHIMSESDEDLARPVETKFRQEGMTVFTNTKLHKFTKDGSRKIVHFSHEGQEKTSAAEVILQALGRRPNIDRLNLEAAEVEIQEGKVVVDNTTVSYTHLTLPTILLV